MRGGMGGGGDVSLGGSGGGGLGGRGGGFPVGKVGPDENGAWGRLTTIFSGSLLCSVAPDSLGLGVTGVLAGDCLNTAPGEPKLGLTRGDTSSLLRLPITRGFG